MDEAHRFFAGEIGPRRDFALLEQRRGPIDAPRDQIGDDVARPREAMGVLLQVGDAAQLRDFRRILGV